LYYEKYSAMLCLDTYEVVNRILKMLKVQSWSLLRFDEGRNFNATLSIWRPHDLIDVVDDFARTGLEFLGGYTDRGLYKLVNAYANIKGWLNGERVTLGFSNLYWVFFVRMEPPSGLLVLTPECLVFVQGINEPNEEIWLGLADVPKDEKIMLNELALKHRLRWWGDQANPILYIGLANQVFKTPRSSG